MRDGLLREVDAAFTAQRAENAREEARRLDEAMGRDPVIGTLVEKRLALFTTGTRAAFASPQNAQAISEGLQRDIAALQADIRRRLAAAGLPETYLQPVYDCPDCRDTGYVGEPIRERCTCYARRLREQLLRDTGHGINPGETFEKYDETVFPNAPGAQGDSQRAYMARVKARCEAYANAYPDTDRPNLLFVGKSGLGKTYLMNCIGNRVRERGHEALKVTAYQLTERMRAAIFDRDKEAFSVLLDVPLLLLDDLGAEPVLSNITIEQLFTLLNERGLNGLSTIVSTNLMLDELKARYTERVCSRLFDKSKTAIVQFYGEDIRLR